MSNEQIPQSAGPLILNIPSRWAYIDENNHVIEVTYLSQFTLNGVTYQQNILLSPESELKTLGLYKVVINFPTISSFQYVVSNPDIAAGNIDHSEKTINVIFAVNSHTWPHIKEIINSEVARKLDEFAKTRGYDNIISCASYANSTNLSYKQEAEYCIQLRDQVWAIINDWINKVDNYEIEMPKSMEQIYKKLPEFNWPQ